MFRYAMLCRFRLGIAASGSHIYRRSVYHLAFLSDITLFSSHVASSSQHAGLVRFPFPPMSGADRRFSRR